MLPGFTRTAAQPASMAANTYLGWKWMSAITGIWDLLAMSGSASASSWDGTATRTIWQPAAVSSAICCSVALTSAVSVVVIDCTETGAPPPTGTACLPLPTMIWRDFLRAASGAGGSWGSPRSTVMIAISPYTWRCTGLKMSAAISSVPKPTSTANTSRLSGTSFWMSTRPGSGPAAAGRTRP